MADTKITALAAIATVDPAADVLPIVDISDTSMAASGTTKKVTTNQILGSGGTATLASATITGNLTASQNIYVPASTTYKIGPVGSTWGGLRFDSTNQAFLDSDIGLTFRTGGATSFTTSYQIGATGISTWSVAGTTAMTLNSTGLGLGVSPVTALSFPIGTTKIVAQSAVTAHLAGNAGTMKFGISDGGGDYSGMHVVNSHGGTYSSQDLLFFTGEGGVSTTTERMRITRSGNVGIGVTPSAWLSSLSALQVKGVNGLYGAGSSEFGSVQNCFYNASSQWIYGTTAAAGKYAISSGVHQWYNAPSGTAGNAITFTQAMTLDASGNLLVGLTVDSYTPAKGVSMFSGNSSRVAVGHANGTSSGDYYHSFAYNSTLIGSISQNGTTGVLYNTSSDYRLKESVKPISGGLARVNALKPSIYNWKSDGSTGEGFLAHELAEVVPFAVSGEKDAVNADGTIKSQGIDMSRIVPILVAAIQELTAEVNALKNA